MNLHMCFIINTLLSELRRRYEELDYVNNKGGLELLETLSEEFSLKYNFSTALKSVVYGLLLAWANEDLYVKVFIIEFFGLNNDEDEE